MSKIKSILGIILFFVIAFFIGHTMIIAWKPKNILINGHDYIEIPEIDGVEIEHRPDCNKCNQNKDE